MEDLEFQGYTVKGFEIYFDWDSGQYLAIDNDKEIVARDSSESSLNSYLYLEYDWGVGFLVGGQDE